MRLNELSDNPGARARNASVGAPALAGKMGGRGIRVRNPARVLRSMATRGPMPLYQRLPKRGFNKPNRKSLPW